MFCCVQSKIFLVKHFLSWLLLPGNFLIKNGEQFLHFLSVFFIYLILQNITLSRTQQQQEVLLWLLEPLSKQWTQSEWQEAYLTDPISFVRLCADTRFMWSIFHIVTFFEKALKRSGYRKGSLSLENSSEITPPGGHPMASHLLWMMPPLFKVRNLCLQHSIIYC